MKPCETCTAPIPDEREDHLCSGCRIQRYRIYLEQLERTREQVVEEVAFQQARLEAHASVIESVEAIISGLEEVRRAEATLQAARAQS